MGEINWPSERSGMIQLALAVVGCTAYCLYARSWRSLTHVVYDVPASLATFAFIAQLVLEAIGSRVGWFWAARFGLLAAMTTVTAGREYLGWNLSGHLSCVLAVALVQTADPRLPPLERLLYWVPLPIVLAIRWYEFDEGRHWQTYHAVIFAVVCSLPAIVLGRLSGTR